MTDHTAAIIFGILAALLVVSYTVYRAIQSNRLKRRLEDEAWQRYIGKPIPSKLRVFSQAPIPFRYPHGSGLGAQGPTGPLLPRKATSVRSETVYVPQTSFDFETLNIPTGETSPQSDRHFSGVTDFGSDFHGGGGDFGGGGASDSWGSSDSCSDSGGSSDSSGGDCGGSSD